MVLQKTELLLSQKSRLLQPSPIGKIHELLEKPGMRSLAGAWPDPAVFQAEEITDIIANLLSGNKNSVLQYGSTSGNIELRKILAEIAGQNDGIDCVPEQIMITAGSAQGLDLACRIFLDPEDIVLVGLPSYFGGTGTIASYGAQNVGLPVDQDGLQVDGIEETLTRLKKTGKSVKAVYVIPNFQNPTGTTLSLYRRKKLLELATRHHFMIFEDDPYGELRFEGDHVPSLMALDKEGCVIHFRSVSKTFSPGMRLAWCAGPADIIAKLDLAKQFSDISTNTLAQFVLLEMIKRGAFHRGIEKSIHYYRKKRDLMLDLMKQHFPPNVSWTKPSGGFFTFVTLPGDLDADELLTDALRQKIAFVTGPSFFVDGSGANNFRLSYSQASREDIKAAIPPLGKLIKQRFIR